MHARDDAAVSKLSACLLGYYEDEYMKVFVRKQTRRSPLINRGYYARVAAMDIVIGRFLASASAGGATRTQVVVMGAGSDTTFFRLRARGTLPSVYVEVDLRGVVKKKLGVMARHAGVREALGVRAEDVQAAIADRSGSTALQGPGFALACADLRDTEGLEQVLRGVAGFDMDAPTLFVSECVLCYVDPASSDALLAWALARFRSAALVTYEQILPDDAFGRTMLGHFERRGCPLLSIRAFPDVEAQEKRFRKHGFSQVEVFDMNDVYYKCLDRDDVRRAEKLEIFDEFEEWHMMQAHYVVALAVRDAPAQGGALGGLLSELKLLLKTPASSTDVDADVDGSSGKVTEPTAALQAPVLPSTVPVTALPATSPSPSAVPSSAALPSPAAPPSLP